MVELKLTSAEFVRKISRRTEFLSEVEWIGCVWGALARSKGTPTANHDGSILHHASKHDHAKWRVARIQARYVSDAGVLALHHIKALYRYA